MGETKKTKKRKLVDASSWVKWGRLPLPQVHSA